MKIMRRRLTILIYSVFLDIRKSKKKKKKKIHILIQKKSSFDIKKSIPFLIIMTKFIFWWVKKKSISLYKKKSMPWYQEIWLIFNTKKWDWFLAISNHRFFYIYKEMDFFYIKKWIFLYQEIQQYYLFHIFWYQIFDFFNIKKWIFRYQN